MSDGGSGQMSGGCTELVLSCSDRHRSPRAVQYPPSQPADEPPCLTDLPALRTVPEVWADAKHRFYVVFSAPADHNLIGIWYAPWGWLESLLPGNCLIGSGVSINSFGSFCSALNEWKRRRPNHEFIRQA